MSRGARTLLLLFALAAQGCATVRPAENPAVLRIAPRFEAAVHAAGPPALTVSPVLGGGASNQRRYIYVDRAEPGVVRQAASLFWDEPPPTLLQRALVDGLRARLGEVTGPDTPISSPRRLTVRLLRFEEAEGGGATRNSEAAEAVVAFDATLTDQTTRTLALAGRYCARAPIAGSRPSDRAAAFETAVQRSVMALAADLARGAASPAAC